jgi:thioredoxin-disulfide reductase
MVYDLIIIGGGPAGVTAGIYTARQRLNVLLLSEIIGGQLSKKAVAIENYPGFEAISGIDLIAKFEKHLRKQKIDIERDEVLKLEKLKDCFSVLTKSRNEFKAKVVIVSSGANPRKLKIPGEDEFLAKGVSYCAVCDGPVFRDKDVAVIGGGNSGFETAIFLNSWAKKIYILESSKEIAADKENQQTVKKAGKAKILTYVKPKKIVGTKLVEGLVYEDKETGKEKTLNVQGIIIEIGTQPASSFIKGDLVDFNEKGEIKVNTIDYSTKTPGLFAAGDVTADNFKQIITACGEGCKAAISAFHYISKLKR